MAGGAVAVAAWALAVDRLKLVVVHCSVVRAGALEGINLGCEVNLGGAGAGTCQVLNPL